MKILEAILPPYGGVRQHIKNIQNLSKYDIEVLPRNKFSYKCMIMSYADKKSPLSSNWVKNKKLEMKKLADIIPDPVGKYVTNRYKLYDLIHFHGHPYWPEPYNFKRKNNSFIYSIHQIYQKEDFKSNIRWQSRKELNEKMFNIAKKCDEVISVSKWQQKILNDIGIESIYIPNGVNSHIFQKGNQIKFKEKFGFDDFILFGGDLRFYKRPGLFIKLAESMPEKTFVMKGKNVTEPEIKKMGYNIPKNLKCLGYISFQDLLDAYDACQVFVLTSKNDTLPTSILEAMSAGKVVVGANSAGSKEIISDGKDGFLFAPDDLESLIQKTGKAYENTKIGKNGKKKIKEKYDWKVVIKKIDQLYQEVAG